MMISKDLFVKRKNCKDEAEKWYSSISWDVFCSTMLLSPTFSPREKQRGKREIRGNLAE